LFDNQTIILQNFNKDDLRNEDFRFDDFDSAEKGDLVIANNGSSGDDIIYGDGSFQQAQGGRLHTESRGSIDLYDKLIADVNGDGFDDLTWMYSGGSGLYAFTALSNGDGSFQNAQGGQLLTGNFGSYDAYDKVVADVNGDGLDDITWMYSGGSGFYAFTSLSNGDGTFQQAQGGQLQASNRGSYDAYDKVIGDVNGDGLDDLTWMYSGGSGFYAFTSLSNGDGTFQQAQSGQLQASNRGSYDAYDKVIGDVNGDGLDDITWMYSGGSGLYAFTSLSNGENENFNSGDGDDEVYGQNGRDTINGEAGDDKLYGEGDDDVINGGEGNDNISGGLGVDLLIGGSGADSFDFSSLEDSSINVIDNIEDFEQGIDKINLAEIEEGLSFNSFEFTVENGHTIIKDKNSDFAIDVVGQFNLTEDDFNF